MMNKNGVWKKMKKRVIKIVALGLLATCLGGSLVSADGLYDEPIENYIVDNQDTDAIAEVFTEEEMLELCSKPDSQISLMAKVIEPDPYEPNDTRETAYPYSEAKKMTGRPFFEGYRNSNTHVEGDEDFFSITLTPSFTYDVVLKNIYQQDKHIYIWEKNSDGTWSRWKKRNQVAGAPEYFTFTPSVYGTHYIQISGGGVEETYYFFAVERTGTINTDLYPSSSNL